MTARKILIYRYGPLNNPELVMERRKQCDTQKEAIDWHNKAIEDEYTLHLNMYGKTRMMPQVILLPEYFFNAICPTTSNIV